MTAEKTVDQSASVEQINPIARSTWYTAFSEFKNAKYADASTRLRNALEVLPDEPILTSLLGKTLMLSGETASALDVMQRLNRLKPLENEYTLLLGWGYQSTGQNKLAKELFSQAAKSAVDDFSRRLAVAHLANQQRKYPQALAAVKSAQLLETDSVGAWSLAAEILLKLKRFEDAKKSVERSLVVTPFFTRDLVTLGLCEEGLKNFDAAMSAYEAAMASAPRSSIGYERAYWLAIRTGQFRKSWSIINRSVDSGAK